MYMRVHFFTVFCFPAAGVGPLAAARDLTAERGRMRLCPGSCPQLLLATAATSAHTGAAAWLLCWDQELLASQGLSGPVPPHKEAAGTHCWHPRPGRLLIHCEDAGEAAGPMGCFTLAHECRLWPRCLRQVMPRTPEQENEESPLFPQERVCVFPPG